jgi:hypothetical protein
MEKINLAIVAQLCGATRFEEAISQVIYPTIEVSLSDTKCTHVLTVGIKKLYFHPSLLPVGKTFCCTAAIILQWSVQLKYLQWNMVIHGR